MTSTKTVSIRGPLFNHDGILRRYVDLPKYIDLIRSKTLYLQRVDLFPDRYEGALPPMFRKGLDELYNAGKSPHGAEYYYRRARLGNYLSCWSLGGKDNMALWQLYGGAKSSIAITTTAKRLIRWCLFNYKKKVVISKVRYIDHARNPDMVLGSYDDMLDYKHEAYKFENEVRVIIPRQHTRWTSNPKDLRVPISDLNSFIRSVVVAPEAGDWFFDAIKDVTLKYGLDIPVRKSALTKLP